MQDRIATAFARASSEGRPALMPYVTAGDPDGTTLDELILSLSGAGADVIEIGVPFSDPIADGPVIASAMYRALARGTTPADVFRAVAAVRDRTEAALVAMVSDSIVMHRGRERFVSEAATAGLDGLIIPDTDTDRLDELAAACTAHGIAFVPLIAPTSSRDRQERLLRHAAGFVYLLARAGVTGMRDDAPEIDERVATLRGLTELPIGVGFGISSADHVRAVGRSADGAIIGSALVQSLHEAAEAGEDVIERARRFVGALTSS